MSAMGHDRITAAATEGLAKLLAVTDSHPGESLGDAYLGRTTTDLLAHIHGWHTLFEGWIEAHRAGEPVAYPAEGYSWNELGALNEALYKAHSGRSYDAVRAALVESHHAVLALVAGISETELVEASQHA
ncbi:MAG: ClbS/DfsB family four-helix bundle protein, partial [Demequinaceae bacterium]|nr:ClbS/DfsB family four-helix bundle protein [Demequinaceae bacterium]